MFLSRKDTSFLNVAEDRRIRPNDDVGSNFEEIKTTRICTALYGSMICHIELVFITKFYGEVLNH